jgi:hypothetical protein
MATEQPIKGQFVTRSIVSPKTSVKMIPVPEIANEIESYTKGRFETRSIVSPKVYVALQPLTPCLKLRFHFASEVQDKTELYQHVAKILDAVIDLQPDLKLRYAEDQSHVEEGEFTAVLLPEMSGPETAHQLEVLLSQLRSANSEIEVSDSHHAIKLQSSMCEVAYA